MESEESGAEAQWRAFEETVRTEQRSFFDGEGAITGARAPGRLDVLGGIADYSGSVVLEGTLAAATCAAVQARPDRLLRVRSLGEGPGAAAGASEAEISLDALLEDGRPRDYADARARMAEPRSRRWAAYVVGCLHALMAEGKLHPARATGLNLLIASTVPSGAGVSSSAALEVATMTALAAHFGVDLEGMELARLCQIVENRLVGAPCGIMDQVTSALGREESLLALECRPHRVLGYEALPPGWRFVGLDSGVKHSVGGGHYARARVGAFMGLRIVESLTGRDLGGYLCRLSPEEWSAVRADMPETLTGAEYTRRYGPLPDAVTAVDPAETYRVQACAEHPVLENARVRAFLDLMREARERPEDTALRELAGRLLLDAHASYGERVDLGAPETDLLVALAMVRGPQRGLYGAKITGGGSGGTVAVLCAGPEADAALEEVRAEYARRTGITPRLLAGSSPGAVAFGARGIVNE